MGRLFARQLGKKHRVLICGRNTEKTKKTAAQIHVEPGSIAEIAKADIVIVSVPIENTVEVCKDILPRMRDHSLLVEVSSVKTGVVDKIAEMVPSGIEYLSLHPLFGPSTRQLKGQNIVAIPMKSGPLSSRMLASIQDMGFSIRISTMEEHDRTMASLQVMHHYAYLIMAVELAKMIKENRVASGFFTRSLKRTWNQLRSLQKISETVVGIQRLNPYGYSARRSYAESAQRMMAMSGEAVSEITEALKIVESTSSSFLL